MPTPEHPGTSINPSRWKHISPLAQSESLSQSPSQADRGKTPAGLPLSPGFVKGGRPWVVVVVVLVVATVVAAVVVVTGFVAVVVVAVVVVLAGVVVIVAGLGL